MKSLVFPRIFLHCVALGFIVSGLLLSETPRVQLPPGTPFIPLQAVFDGLQRFFVAVSICTTMTALDSYMHCMLHIG